MFFLLPAIVAGVSALASAAGSVVQGVGAANAGAEAERTSQYNSFLGKIGAADAVRRGAVESARIRSQGTRVAGAVRSALGSSGVDVSSGSAVDMQAASRGVAEIDALTARNNAFREAWGLKTQAADILKQGKQAAAAGTQQAVGSFLGGAGSLINGASDTYRLWKSGQ